MARIRNRRKPVAEMNVVPYIDVMLVLLVIFMVTAPMLNQGVKVDLPKVSSEVLPQDNDAQVLTISIKADKTYYWNIGSEVDTDTVQDKAVASVKIREIKAGGEPGKRAKDHIGSAGGLPIRVNAVSSNQQIIYVIAIHIPCRRNRIARMVIFTDSVQDKTTEHCHRNSPYRHSPM